MWNQWPKLIIILLLFENQIIRSKRMFGLFSFNGHALILTIHDGRNALFDMVIYKTNYLSILCWLHKIQRQIRHAKSRLEQVQPFIQFI